MSGSALVSANMSVQFILVQIWVQYGDRFGKEAVPESISSGQYGPEAPARGQQVEVMEAGVGGVFQGVSGPAETAGVQTRRGLQKRGLPPEVQDELLGVGDVQWQSINLQHHD